MSTDAVLTALQGTEFVRGLEQRHLEQLAAMATEVNFPAGETIFREGDLSNTVYLIREGQVAVEAHVPSRGRVTLLTVGPGQLLAWSSLFPPRRKTASARTVAPTWAIAFDATRLREACQMDCELGYTLIWRVAEVIADRLKATRLQLLDVFAPGGEF